MFRRPLSLSLCLSVVLASRDASKRREIRGLRPNTELSHSHLRKRSLMGGNKGGGMGGGMGMGGSGASDRFIYNSNNNHNSNHAQPQDRFDYGNANANANPNANALEQHPCIPFSAITAEAKMNPDTDESCRTNQPKGYCCRAYWFLIDDVDDYVWASCICNGNTRDPASWGRPDDLPNGVLVIPGTVNQEDMSSPQSYNSPQANNGNTVNNGNPDDYVITVDREDEPDEGVGFVDVGENGDNQGGGTVVDIIEDGDSQGDDNGNQGDDSNEDGDDECSSNWACQTEQVECCLKASRKCGPWSEGKFLQECHNWN